jgi:hypothetical protein
MRTHRLDNWPGRRRTLATAASSGRSIAGELRAVLLHRLTRARTTANRAAVPGVMLAPPPNVRSTVLVGALVISIASSCRRKESRADVACDRPTRANLAPTPDASTAAAKASVVEAGMPDADSLPLREWGNRRRPPRPLADKGLMTVWAAG